MHKKALKKVPFEECGSQFKNNYKYKLEHFLNKEKHNKKYIRDNYDDLCKTIQTLIETKNIRHDSIYNSCINTLCAGNITVEQCNIILNDLLEKYPEIIKLSTFKKAACYMWYYKYEKK